jgi:hypothetical protein
MSPSTAIKWSTPASDVEQQLDTLNAGQKEGHWQLRLRMLVLPQSTSELKELDPAAYEYYFAQIVNDFIATSHLKVSGAKSVTPALLVDGFLAAVVSNLGTASITVQGLQ